MKNTILYKWFNPKGSSYKSKMEILDGLRARLRNLICHCYQTTPETIDTIRKESIIKWISQSDLKYAQLLDLLSTYILEDISTNGDLITNNIKLDNDSYRLLNKLLDNIKSRIVNTDYFLGDEEEINVCCDSRVPYSNESKEKICREKDLKEKIIEGVLKEKRKRGRPRKEKENEESND